MRLFLDIDGVLADFTTAANALHRKHGYVPTRYDYYHDWGMTESDFWAPINKAGDPFWASIEELPHCHEVVAVCEKHFGVRLCLLSNAAFSGRREWIRRKLGTRFHNRFLLGPAKPFCAGPDSVLVDDCEANVEAFTRAGGIGVLFPASYNRLRDVGGKVSYLDEELKAIVRSPVPSA